MLLASRIRGGVMAIGGLEESAQRHLTLGNVNLDARTVAIAQPVLLANVVGALHPTCNSHGTCITSPLVFVNLSAFR
jgi:hypothetical protein